MTTFHTFDIDSVPPPSDYELARPLTVTVTAPPRYGFNGATKLLNINGDRFEFWTWCGRHIDRDATYTEDDWRFYRKAFVAMEDARDLLNTQADALI